MIVFLFMSIQTGILYPGQPFSQRGKRECIITGMGILLCGGGYFFYQRIKPLDPNLLDPKKLLCMDRFTLQCHDERTALLSDVTAGICLLMPLIPACSAQNDEQFRTQMLMTVESYLINIGITGWIKGIVQRPRPYVYRSGCIKGRKHAASSFFSLHSSIAFNGAILTAMMFQEQEKDNKWVVPIWIGGLGAATATGIFRITSGNHFLTDVIVGAVVGSVIGYGVVRLHQ